MTLDIALVRCVATKLISFFFQGRDDNVPYTPFAVSTRKQRLALLVIYAAVENLNFSPLIPSRMTLSLMKHCGFPMLILLSLLRSTDSDSTELHSGKKISLSSHGELFSAILLIFIYHSFNC